MLPKILEKNKNIINGVLHVGAHEGLEIEHYKDYNFNKIYFFEPQKNIYQKLLNNVSQYDNVECFNFALGSENKLDYINKSKGNDGLSSSILKPDLHLKVQPSIKFDNKEEIEIKRYDSLKIQQVNFLTLDVQGYELEVLKGFGQELKNLKFIFTEINTKFLYKENALVKDLDNYLSDYGFIRVFTNVDCFKYYGDALYVKSSKIGLFRSLFLPLYNKLNTTNLLLHLKKLLYPKKALKNLITKI